MRYVPMCVRYYSSPLSPWRIPSMSCMLLMAGLIRVGAYGAWDLLLSDQWYTDLWEPKQLLKPCRAPCPASTTRSIHSLSGETQYMLACLVSQVRKSQQLFLFLATNVQTLKPNRWPTYVSKVLRTITASLNPKP